MKIQSLPHFDPVSANAIIRERLECPHKWQKATRQLTQGFKGQVLLGKDRGLLQGAGWAMQTHRGWLHSNEDSLGHLATPEKEWIVLADGVGGCLHPKQASNWAVANFLSRAKMDKDIFTLPKFIHDQLLSFLPNMVMLTTLIAIEIDRASGQLKICSIGNSGILAVPLYKAELGLLTRYHQRSWESAGLKHIKTSAPLSMTDLVKIKPYDREGDPLLACLGMHDELAHLDKYSYQLEPAGDLSTRLVVFSDGALLPFKPGAILPEEKMADLARSISDPADCAKAIIHYAMRGFLPADFFENLELAAGRLGFAGLEEYCLTLAPANDLITNLRKYPGFFGVSAEQIETFRRSVSFDNISVAVIDLIGMRLTNMVNFTTTPDLTRPPLHLPSSYMQKAFDQCNANGSPEEEV